MSRQGTSFCATAALSVLMAVAAISMKHREYEFEKFSGHKVADSFPLFTSTVRSVAGCAVLCVNQPTCLSFDIGRDSGGGLVTCQGSASFAQESLLQVDEDVDHHRIMAPLTCDATWMTSCYVIDTSRRDRADSIAFCDGLPADSVSMATLETADESDFLGQIVADLYQEDMTTQLFNFGLDWNETSDTYIWRSTQETPTYYQWLSGDPGKQPGETSVGFYRDTKHWADWFPYELCGVICELHIRIE